MILLRTAVPLVWTDTTDIAVTNDIINAYEQHQDKVSSVTVVHFFIIKPQ